MRTSLIALTAALASATPAMAQGSKESWTPSEIVVTAKRADGYVVNQASSLRSSVPIQATPQSVQVLTKSLIKDQELNSLDEALANVSGVTPSHSSEMMLINPIIRGFEAEIFSDGLIGYGDTAVSDPASLWSAERVEVAKGPTSTLFGGGTGAPVGGLINVVSKTANFDQSFSFRLRGGSFRTKSAAADGNLPLSDAIAIRLLGEVQKGGDYIDNVDISRKLLAPSIRIRPSNTTDIVARITYSKIEQNEYAGLPARFAYSPLVKRDRFTSASNAPKADIENFSGSIELTQKLTDAIKANVRLRRYSNQTSEYSSSPLFAFSDDLLFGFFYPCTINGCTQFDARLDTKVKEWTFDGSLTAEFSTGPVQHVLLAGAQWDRVNYYGMMSFSQNPDLYDYTTPGSDISYNPQPLATANYNLYKTRGLYIQDQIEVGDRIHVLLSLRHSQMRIREVFGAAIRSQTYNEINPRVGLTVDLTKGVSLFTGYSTGSRMSLTFTGTNRTAPEGSKSLEGGVKFALSDTGLSGTIAAYKLKRTNVPTPDPLNPGRSVQTGEQTSKGVELDLIYEPSKAISLLASYALTDAKVTADTNIPVGSRLARVSKNRGRFAARYRFLDGGLKGMELGAGGTYVGKAPLMLPSNLLSTAYTVFDAQASYTLGKARLGLRIDNIANKRYFTPYSYYAQEVVRPGNPRSAYVTLSFDL
jgi:iron complex outermembrane recepter protein